MGHVTKNVAVSIWVSKTVTTILNQIFCLENVFLGRGGYEARTLQIECAASGREVKEMNDEGNF